MTAYFQHTDPDVFSDPDRFVPDRWLSPDAPKMARNFVLFSRGSRNCIGMNLATAEINFMLTALFRPGAPKFELFETGETDVVAVHDYIVPLARLDSKGFDFSALWYQPNPHSQAAAMSQAEDSASYDCIIVGAGLTGIVAAQRLLQAHPETQLVILERDYCLGGVWGERRNYPSFWSQWTHGIAEFSDMPMERPPPKDCMHDLFRAKYTTNYLEDYVNNMSHSGKTLRDRIQFNTQVQSIRKTNGQWNVICLDVNTNSQRSMCSPKLMMANGQASIPNVPHFAGQEYYSGQIIHSIDFGQSDIVQDQSIEGVYKNESGLFTGA
ncbi:dimethylaniline monooxygenase [Apiospora aurea]|uniref:Dimethylaniline monooxygenase n=1 Tax=Apiospora aurea TaxID=335848 RepID=A0ABR1PTF4_9PEZI